MEKTDARSRSPSGPNKTPPAAAGSASHRGSTEAGAGDAQEPRPRIGTASGGPRPATATQHPDEAVDPSGTTQTGARSAPRSLPDTFLDERDDVLSVINELEDQLDRQEETRLALERELTESNQQLQSASQRVQELEWQVVTLQTRVDALEQVRQEVGLLEEEIADANGRAQRLNEQLGRTEKENARLSNELKTANKQLEELWAIRKERDSFRVDIKTLKGKLDQLERSQRDWLEERAQVLTRLKEAQITLEETRSARHQLEMEQRSLEERNQELRRVQETLEEKLEALRGEKKSLQAQLTHVERENTRLIEQQQYYECELTSLRSMNRTAESALTNVKKAFAEVRVALTETKARVRRRTSENWPRPTLMLRGIDTTLDGGQPESHEAPSESDALDSPDRPDSPAAVASGESSENQDGRQYD